MSASGQDLVCMRFVATIGGAAAFGILLFFHKVGVWYMDAFYVALLVSVVLSILALILWPLILRYHLETWVAVFHVIAGPSLALSSLLLCLFSLDWGLHFFRFLAGVWALVYSFWMIVDGVYCIREGYCRRHRNDNNESDNYPV